MKNIVNLYTELNVGVYYTTWIKRIINRYDLEEGIDIFYKDDGVYLTDNVYEHIKNTYSKSKKLKEHRYVLDTINIENNFNELNDIVVESKQNKKIKDLNKQIKILSTAVDSLSNFKQIFNDTLFDYTYKPKAKKIFNNEYISPVLVLTDLHIGQLIQKSWVYNQNVYNTDIAEARIEYAVDKFINHYKNMQNYEIKDIHVMLLGDLIHNSMHESPIDIPVAEQIIRASTIILNQLNKIKNAFKNIEIYVYGVCGNHGRESANFKYMPHHNILSSSYENIIFYHIKNNGFDIITDESNEIITDINGCRLLLIHGDQLKVNLKSPNSIFNQLSKKNKQFLSMDTDSFDIVLMGHLHGGYISDNLIIGSSPVGICPYSKSLNLEKTDAAITSFCIDSNGSISNYKQINVQHIK